MNTGRIAALITTFLIITFNLTACGQLESEHKKLGFSSPKEMEEIRKLGWHTKQRFDFDTIILPKEEFENVLYKKYAELLRIIKVVELGKFGDKYDKGQISRADLIKMVTQQVRYCKQALDGFRINSQYKTESAREIQTTIEGILESQCERYKIGLGVAQADRDHLSPDDLQKIKTAVEKESQGERRTLELITTACKKLVCDEAKLRAIFNSEPTSREEVERLEEVKMALTLPQSAYKTNNYKIVFICSDRSGAGIHRGLAPQLLSAASNPGNSYVYAAMLTNSTYARFCQEGFFSPVNDGSIIRNLNNPQLVTTSGKYYLYEPNNMVVMGIIEQ